MKIIFLMPLVVLFASCTTYKPPTKPVTEQILPESDTIVFISMRMWYNQALGQNAIELLNVIKQSGSLKEQLPETFETKNYLICRLLNAAGNAVDSFRIAHPLFKSVEYATDKNELSKKEIWVNEAEFFIRFKKNGYNSLTISEHTVIAGNKPLTLLNF